MHKKFNHQTIEKKWQEHWDATNLYTIDTKTENKNKEYVLVEWPYPSGNLHIGHWYAFAVPDIYVRMRRMQGANVLFPIGFDAFGLPAENAAIKRNINPREWTEQNITYMIEQLKSMGNGFNWDTTCSSTDESYYKWTQWMFTQFFEKGLAYRGEAVVNWDPIDNTVIANEQVLPDGTSERSGAVVEKKRMPQWMLRITDYADRLIDDLDNLDWPEHIKEAQRQWIGRSKGAEIDFTLSTGDTVTVFTTRPDTLFGATYLVLAPEHPLLEKNKASIKNYDEVDLYVKASTQKDEQDRLDATKEKTGVKLEGISATNPANGESIPVYVADYVLGHYGTGAIMAVPAHDERDYAFASKFNIEIRQVVRKVTGTKLENCTPRTAVGAIVHNPKDNTYLIQYVNAFDKHAFIFGGVEDGEQYEDAAIRETYEETGYKTKFVRFLTDERKGYFFHPGKNENRELVSRRVLLELVDELQDEITQEEKEKTTPVWANLEDLNNLLVDEDDIDAVKAIHSKDIIFTEYGELCNSEEFDGLDSETAKDAIVKKVNGRMTNTYRLRDWSIGRQRYWGVPIPIVYSPEGVAHIVPEEHLPWTLPEDVDFTPTGEPPLKKSKELHERTERIFGPGWTPEVETMDTFVDSSWYFLRYLDNDNHQSLSDIEAQKQWLPIDIYFGGAEHTTMHLLYSRFWQKALFDLGLTPVSEPYKRRINRGLILGPDGEKMSKSKGNVIDPDKQVKTVGADTVKMYLAFMGPYEGSNYPFDLGGIAGIRRFLERVNGLNEHVTETEDIHITKAVHKAIVKVTTDIQHYKFNTAISTMMKLINDCEKQGLSESSYHTFLTLLAPFAPHLTEELWQEAGYTESIHLNPWPVADGQYLVDDEVTIGVQFNGKRRGDITIPVDAEEAAVMELVKSDEKLKNYLPETIKKVVYVPKRILNIIG